MCVLQTDKSDPDPPTGAGNNSNVPPLADMDSLTEGTYLDCKRANGVWEIASIVRFSEYRTELEITWMDGEEQQHKHWQPYLCTVM